MLSCSTDSTTMYRLKTSVNPSEGGTVDPQEGEYEGGESVQVKATAHQHWVFSKWEGDHSGTGSTATIMMDRDKYISALFIKREYPLTVNVEGEGTVNERVVQQKTTDYESGTTVELTAVAGEGWVFTSWQGDAEGTENPITIEITGEKEITAIFEKREYPLTVNIEGEGTVAEEVVQDKTTNYPYQTIVSLTAVPSEGWIFSHWLGDLTGSENPAQLEVTEAKGVTAVFVRDYFTINITLGGPGTWTVDLISGNQQGDTYEYESLVQITVQPLQDWMEYRFVEWQGDLSGTENPIEVTVTGNITATAVMEQTLFEGEGMVDNPYKVATLEQLQAVRGFIDKHFLQVADIDASETAAWNDGQGFIPIAFTGSGSFSGSYDGDGYKISGLHIDLRGGIYLENTYAGLFGKINSALIKDLTLTDIEIISIDGIVGTGGLAGWAGTESSIQNVHVTGTVSGYNNIGGLIGIADDVAINSATTDVIVNGNYHIGGLAGYSRLGWVYNSHTTGSVSGYQGVGGLIGNRYVGELINNSSSKGDVTGTNNVGGLIGNSFDTIAPITVSYATGNVSGDQNVGGLIGIFSGTALVYQTYAAGAVTSGNNGQLIGGLIGRFTSGELSKSYALGAVSGHTGVGGAVGRNDSDGVVAEIYSVGLVSGTQTYGGLIGSNQGVLSLSYWDTESSGINSPVWDPYQGTTSATGLTTLQMTGTNAQANMPDFDWGTTWEAGLGYPVLRALPTLNP